MQKRVEQVKCGHACRAILATDGILRHMEFALLCAVVIDMGFIFAVMTFEPLHSTLVSSLTGNGNINTSTQILPRRN
jgi:hypothetical protein